MDHLEGHAPDTELNLTPMIDVVFQLIIFFLLTLKFKEIDRQIDANLPQHRGMEAKPTDPLEEQRVVLAMFRREHRPGTDEGHTVVRVDRSHVVRLEAEGDARERDLERLRGALRARLAAGADPMALIRVRTPHDGLVPHADVMSVLDCCVEAGLGDVSFEGAKGP